MHQFIYSLNVNHITSKGASCLFNTLRESRIHISKIYLSHNSINDEIMDSLGEYIATNPKFEGIHLGINPITDKGIATFTENLIGNTSLKELDFSQCGELTDSSFCHFLEIAQKTCIKDIKLEDTYLRHEQRIMLRNYLATLADQREIPIKSNTKSATKRTLD